MPAKLRKGRYEIAGSERGVRFHKVLPKGAKRSDATEYEGKIRRDIFNAKELGHVPEYSIGEAILRYLKEFQGKSRKQTENHAKALEPFVTGKSLSEIMEVSKGMVGRPAGKRKREPTKSTINRRLAILRRVAHLAYSRWGWLKEPLHEKIEMLPENPPRTVYLSRGEVAAMLKGIPDREMRRAALALTFTGLRKGELMGLKPDDIRGGTICLADTKTGTPRNVPILPSVRFAFKRLPFSFYPTSLTRAIKRATAGRVRAHDLRHTCASLLIQNGVPLYTVGAILGHSSVATTKRYSHLDLSSMEAAISKLEPKREPAKKEKAA